MTVWCSRRNANILNALKITKPTIYECFKKKTNIKVDISVHEFYKHVLEI